MFQIYHQSSYFGDSMALLILRNINYNELINSFITKILNQLFHVDLLFLIIGTFNIIFLCLVVFYFFPRYQMNKSLIIFLIFILFFSPIRTWHSFEWISYANWGFLLGWIFSLYLYLKTNIKKYLILTIFFYLFTYLNHIFQGVMLSLLSVGVFLFMGIEGKDNWKRLLKAYLLQNLILLPFLFFFVINTAATYNNLLDISRSPEARWAYSARPWHYLIPDINNPIFGDLAVKIHYKIWQSPPYYLTEPFFPKEHTLFLGYTLIGLSSYLIYLTFLKRNDNYKCTQNAKNKNLINKINVLFKSRGVVSPDTKKLVIYFLSIGITGFILSIPPYIALNNVKIYFPSYFLYEIIPQLRAYARFGVFVFIANSLLAIISLQYIMSNLKIGIIFKSLFGKIIPNKDLLKLKKTLILVSVFLMVIIEFINFPPFHVISTYPTPPYVWLSEQKEDFAYLEVPSRNDYSDRIYQKFHGKKILNPYLDTPTGIKEIERSLYEQDFAKFYSKWCVDFKNNHGRYIFYHLKDQNKSLTVKNFIETNEVTPMLKTALAESWGFPVWGTHADLSEDAKFRIDRDRKMLDLLLNEPLFELVQHFNNTDIIKSRSNTNFSADKFDEVYIFKINETFCESLGYE
jgi:hypothetical protein